MANESLVFDALDLNDDVDLVTESLNFTPASPKPLWVGNADSDGEGLVDEARYGNSSFELQIRVLPAPDMDAALEVHGTIVDKLQKAQRTEGGIPLEWTPAEASTTYTAYVLFGEVTELPITPEGDLAGWFLNSPVVKVKLTTRPFLYTDERVVKSNTESAAEPLQELFLTGVLGDVAAEGTLVITDKATQDRRHLEWGLDRQAESTPDCLIKAASLSISGFSGSSTTRSGAYSEEKVKRATALSQPAVVAGTGSVAFVGSYRVWARVYCNSANARFRISYRNGKGPLVPLDFVAAPVTEAFSEIDLGEVSFDEALLGTQTSEIRFETKSLSGTSENDLNYLLLIPTTNGRGNGRGRPSNKPIGTLAYDPFEQTAGALTGKTAALGGTWSGAGDAVGLTVEATNHWVKREEKSDASITAGHYARLGAGTAANLNLSVDIWFPPAFYETHRQGLFARYSSTSNWVMATYDDSGKVGDPAQVRVYKNVSGTVTQIGAVSTTATVSGIFAEGWRTLQMTLNSAGELVVYEGALGSPGVTPVLSLVDKDLSAAGALATGGYGIYDAYTGTGLTAERRYDAFSAVELEAPGIVVYSGKKGRARWDGYLREDSTGTYNGPASSYRGANFYLPPGASRLVTKLRRTDVDLEEAANVTDKMSCEVLARERYLTPR